MDILKHPSFFAAERKRCIGRTESHFAACTAQSVMKEANVRTLQLCQKPKDRELKRLIRRGRYNLVAMLCHCGRPINPFQMQTIEALGNGFGDIVEQLPALLFAQHE